MPGNIPTTAPVAAPIRNAFHFLKTEKKPSSTCLNPNVTPEQQKLAVGAALYLFGPEGAQIYADTAGSPMVATGVQAKDPLVTAFAQAAASGFPRPQSVEFGNWWGPFGDAVTKVMEGQLEPAAAVTEACAAMNKASGK